MNRNTLKTLLTTKKANPIKKEAGLYEQLKRASLQYNKKLRLSRIENWMTLGLPDLLLCDHNHKFHFIELKFCKANAVNLSPHQVAWLTRHLTSSSWILVKRQAKADVKATLHLYSASQAISLAEDGLKTPSIGSFDYPFDWDKVFDLISPI